MTTIVNAFIPEDVRHLYFQITVFGIADPEAYLVEDKMILSVMS